MLAEAGGTADPRAPGEGAMGPAERMRGLLREKAATEARAFGVGLVVPGAPPGGLVVMQKRPPFLQGLFPVARDL